MINVQNLKRVLVVDDDKRVLKLLKAILETGGYSVTAASGARAAAKYLSEHKSVDLLVTDIDMPGRTGLELAAEVSDSRPDLPVLFVTGGDDTVNVRTERPQRNILRKPLGARELLATVHQMLSARQ